LITNVFRRMRLLALAVAAAWAMPAPACVEGAPRGEAFTAERDLGAVAEGEEASMQAIGAGWFHAAEIVKRGGTSDQTNVTVELDGQPCISTSFANLKNAWMQIDTPNLIAKVRTEGDTSTMTIWYKPDLIFNTRIAVRIGVEEPGVESLVTRAVLSRALPHSHPAGAAGTVLALPAFK
jgi:hypothetical protein